MFTPFRNTFLRRASLCALVLYAAMNVSAQPKKSFTLDDLMWGGSNYWNLQPANYYAAFWGDRLVRLTVDEASLVANEKGRTVSPKTLFTEADVRAAIGDSAQAMGLNLLNAQFPDGTQPEVLLRTASLSFIYNWEQGKLTWKVGLERGRQAVDFCTASRTSAYLKGHDLYVQTADGTEHRVTTDGSHDIAYAISAHRNEFGYDKGTFFSPSGRLLAFTRQDESMVADYPLVDISAREAVEAPEKYPMAGMTSHKLTIGIYNLETGGVLYLQAGDPTDRYFTNPTWSPDERTLYLIELPRTQDKAELVAYDAQTGERRGVLYTEENSKYVHPTHGLTFLPWDDNLFIYQSERDGYNHLYLMDTSGREVRQLTQGAFVALELAGFNVKDKAVIVKSTESSPLRNNYYSVDVRTGKRRLLDNGLGVHRAVLSQGGKFLFDRWSEPDVYRKVGLTSTTAATTVVLQEDGSPWQDFAVPQFRCGTLKAADGATDLYYRLVLPVGFDPAKQYPTVVYVYGGPGLRNVEERWNYAARPWEVYMAQRGYVLFILDNRGSCDRGFEFESCTFRHLGDEEMRDQLRGVEFLKTLPYVDQSRLGVHGWSFGGFMTTNLMCSYPDVFKVGVAGGPVIDWKYYEVMYGERYMDTPDENPEGYASSSLLPKAKNLKGRLQIIFGYNDPVCVPQHTLSFIRACADAGTQPDLFTYPGQGHNMAGRDQVHLHERITRYFDDYLK